MEYPDRIADMYDEFLREGYAKLALDPGSYPLVPVIADAFGRHGVRQEGASVLDLACGPGLLKRLTSFECYAGVDLSNDMLEAAAAEGYNELVQASLGDYLAILPDGAFDVIVCFSALYFLDEEAVRRVMAEIERVAGSFWLVTFDGPDQDLIDYYEDQRGIAMYDHRGMEVAGAVERYEVPGWKSAVDGSAVPMEVVIGKKV